jgi:4-amino-4-deoxy-L-arabinose transferase-like glycosyltransferase
MLPTRRGARRMPWWLLACLAALPLVATALTCPRLVSNDSFGYLDVARNVAAGRGLSQSVTGWNAARFPAAATWPAPFIAQAPLYPLIAGAVIRIGVAPISAVLLVALIALVAVWFTGAALARELWGEGAGVMVLTVLAASALPSAVPTRAWSETLAIAFALASLRLEVHALAEPAGPSVARAAGVGLLAGLAFDARFAFAIALPVALVPTLTLRARRVRVTLSLLAGWLIAAAPVLIRQRRLAGAWGVVERNASSEGPLALLQAMFTRLGRSGALRTVWIVVAAVVIALLLTRSGRERLRHAWSAAWQPRARLPLVWALAYFVAIMALRSRVQFDSVGLRLLAPAAVMTIVTIAGAPWAGRMLSRGVIAGCAAVFLLIAAIGAVRFARARPLPDAERVAESGLMIWLRDSTRNDDPVIAEDAADLAYYLSDPRGPGRAFASYSAAPYMRPLEEHDLEIFARTHVGTERGVLLVVRGRTAGEDWWRGALGPLISDAVAGRLSAHPSLTQIAETGDGWVFRYRTP